MNDTAPKNVDAMKTRELSAVDDQVGMLTANLGSLYEQVMNLERKLGPVLTPTDMPFDSREITIPQRGGSTLVMQLHELSYRLTDLENVLSNIAQRVEV